MIPIPPALAAEVTRPGLKVILGALALIGAALFGAAWMADHKNAQIADLKTKQAQEQAAIATQARQRLQAAQERGDVLSASLAKTESDLDQKTLEVSREVERNTTGRPCLGAAAVRLLNHTNSGAGAVPQASGAPVAEDGPIATDTDVGGWIANAQGQYETCRARLGALIDFEGSEK